MTLLKDRPRIELLKRQAELLEENRRLLQEGYFDRYQRNCERVRRIVAELNRREREKRLARGDP